MQRRIQSRIEAEWNGATLLGFLTGRFPYHNAEAWMERVAGQRVLVNGSPAGPDQALRTGDTIEHVAHDTPEPPVNLDIRIVHDDADILVIDKPPNLPCHPGGRYFNHTLWAWLKAHHGLEAPAFVNRLDRETSGLVLVARNERAAGICRAQFARHRVQKRYVALVEGQFPDTLQTSGWVLPDPASGAHTRQLFKPESASGPDEAAGLNRRFRAETAFRLLERHGVICSVEAIPRTGRLHQIRATLYALGYPVVGDKLYGHDPGCFLRFCTDTLSPDDRAQLRINRQALHAARLEFRHPAGGRPVSFEAPLPADMLRLMGHPQNISALV